ncbi:MAG TPA: hypothetical protein VGJ15_09825 [Pirellulales bacterium]
MATNNKLVRQLKRELTGNPKKAVTLLLLLGVAAWFWAPLVSKWIGKKTTDDAAALAANDESGTTESAHAAPVPTPAPAATATANSTTPSTPATPSWHQAISWIEADPLTQPRKPLATLRDPFSLSAAQLQAQQQQQVAKQTKPVETPDPTPEESGMVLRSTVVGGAVKTALINSRAYHEHQTITGSDGQSRFAVVEIRPDSVVLSRHGQTFELKLPKVEAAGAED